MISNYDYAFKFILVGDAAVGKTSILSRFLKTSFDRNTDTTLGVEFGQRTMDINGRQIKMQVWDTAGQEEFRSMTRAYYRSSAAALVVYDCTRPQTFKNVKRWVEDVRTNGPKSVLLILICNKIDMADKRKISRNEGLKLATEQDMHYIETSAKSDQHIEQTFVRAAVNILDRIQTGMISVGQEENGIKIDPSKRQRPQITHQKNCCEC